jgi:hypothetical protein
MSLATSANGTNFTAVPSNACPLMRAKRTRHGRRFWSVHDPPKKSVSRNFVFYAADLTRT